MNKEIIKMDMNWASDLETDHSYVEMHYDDKYVGNIWYDQDECTVRISFERGKRLKDRVIRELKLSTLMFMIEIAQKIMRGEAYFDCGVYTEYEKEDSQ